MNLQKPKTFYVWRKYGNDIVFNDILIGVDLSVPTIEATIAYLDGIMEVRNDLNIDNPDVFENSFVGVSSRGIGMQPPRVRNVMWELDDIKRTLDEVMAQLREMRNGN